MSLPEDVRKDEEFGHQILAWAAQRGGVAETLENDFLGECLLALERTLDGFQQGTEVQSLKEKYDDSRLRMTE